MMAGNETSVEAAIQAASRAADAYCLPQTVYKDADSCGYWHINSLASRLCKAEIVVTMLPVRYFT